MAFTSQFSSLPYDCPGLGTSAPMFAMTVIVCRDVKLNKVYLLACLVNPNFLPWIFLVAIQLIYPGTKLFPNFCGCVAGNLYMLWFASSSCIPPQWIQIVDDFLSKTFAYVPIPKYLRSSPTSTKILPVSIQDSSLHAQSPSPAHHYQKISVPSTSHGDVPDYKINKLVQMGFAREESKVALAATNGNIDEATGLLAEARDSNDASILASTSQ